MILFLIDVHPFYKTWPEIKDFNIISDINDAYNEINRLLNEQENPKRRSSKSNQLSDLLYFQHNPTNMNEYDKRNDYYQYEYPPENDHVYNGSIKPKSFSFN